MNESYDRHIIEFTVPDVRRNFIPVKIELQDLLGRMVRVLLNERRQSGKYEMNFDLSSVHPGVYFCVIKINNRIYECKCVKIE